MKHSIEQNPDDKDYFVRLGVVNESRAVVVNGSGIDLAHYASSQTPKPPVKFMFMGRYLREKGIFELVEACSIVQEEFPEARVQLLGATDDNPSSIDDARLKAWEDEGLISNVGWVEDVRPYIHSCSVYVLPSYAEGTPRSSLEALAIGRPIITTDAPGCRETVEHGQNGFLVPVGDSSALATAMLRFLRDPSLVQKMGAESLKLARKRFDVRKVNASILDSMGL